MKKQGASLSVVLIEDDQVLQNHLASVIDSHKDLDVAAAFATLADSLNWLEHARADMALVDLDLPDGSGDEFILKARQCNIECMVLTVFADEQHVTQAIRAGASGYLLKDADSGHVVESILQLLDGQSPISPGIARHILKHFSYPDHKEDGDGASEDFNLTPREIDVLGLIARGYSYQEVADRTRASINTVRTHVRHIYAKLEAHSRSEAVYKAANVGIIKI